MLRPSRFVIYIEVASVTYACSNNHIYTNVPLRSYLNNLGLDNVAVFLRLLRYKTAVYRTVTVKGIHTNVSRNKCAAKINSNEAFSLMTIRKHLLFVSYSEM